MVKIPTCTKKHKLFVVNGKIKTLHNKILDKLLPKLGDLVQVDRASTIEYDNNLHTWVSTILSTGKKFYSDTREEVLYLEEQEINRLIRKGII